MSAPRPDMKHQEALYKARAQILWRFQAVPLRDLERLAHILSICTDDDLRRSIRFLEALADWPLDDASSTDAPQATQQGG